MKRLKFALINATLPLQRWVLRRRIGCLRLEHLDSVPLLVLPEVFNPTLFRSSELLVQTLAKFPHTENQSLLDMGTGSGVGAVFAARSGRRVVAVDVNAEAVRCARINALMNRMETHIDVREGDLFAPVAGMTFDIVLFNPPFFRGVPKGNRDYAWRGTDVLERFAAGLPTVLKPEGHALIVLSSHGDTQGLLDALKAHGMHASPAASREFSNEILTVYVVRACK